MLHGYMSNSGYEDVREAVAQSLNQRFGTAFDQKNIVMTVGAAGGLNVILKTLLNPGDEVMVIAPYFGEYNSYVANYDGKVVVVSPNTDTFQPNLTELEEKITGENKSCDCQLAKQSHRRGVFRGNHSENGGHSGEEAEPVSE